MNNLQKMKELIMKIKEADVAYFQNDAPIMSDREYDALVLELKILEKTTGIHFSDSPIGKVPSDSKEGLKTVRHTKPMLSCNKTKDINDIIKFAKQGDVVLSWKMDGLTLVLRYENGKMIQAITRGSDGIIGEDVTHTVKYFRNIPFVIPCKESFEVRGEGVISWEDFKILSKLSGATSSHPRSIASGAVRAITADRGKLCHLDFFAFELIKDNAPDTKLEQLEFLKENNFTVVEHTALDASSDKEEIKEGIEKWTPESFAYPVDGIVAEYNDIAFGKSLGATAHHEKRMLALKWQDEIKETVFRGVELITTRTGVVSIVGKFDDVIIDGTVVHKANLHNLGNFEKFKFGIGDTIRVYKANMIIPQIAENVTMSATYTLPSYCPCCGETLTVKYSPSGVKDLFCPNEDCIARNAQKIARFCDKGAMNIEGLSASVIENLMAYGWIKSYKDLYNLNIHQDEIIKAPGFGVERYNRIWESIQKSRNCHMYQFLTGIGIEHLGPEAAKILHQYYYGSMEEFEKAIKSGFRFSHIAGISETLERSIYSWYGNPATQKTLHTLMAELKIIGMGKVKAEDASPFFDAVVVVTGTFNSFTREGIIQLLCSLGARVDDNVSEETDFLIYGAMPGGKKVGAALKNGVNMISETTFAEMLEKGN